MVGGVRPKIMESFRYVSRNERLYESLEFDEVLRGGPDDRTQGLGEFRRLERLEQLVLKYAYVLKRFQHCCKNAGLDYASLAPLQRGHTSKAAASKLPNKVCGMAS